MERCGEKMYGRESTGLKEKIMRSPLGHTEFEVLMGHAGGDQKTTRPWRASAIS